VFSVPSCLREPSLGVLVRLAPFILARRSSLSSRRDEFSSNFGFPRVRCSFPPLPAEQPNIVGYIRTTLIPFPTCHLIFPGLKSAPPVLSLRFQERTLRFYAVSSFSERSGLHLSFLPISPFSPAPVRTKPPYPPNPYYSASFPSPKQYTHPQGHLASRHTPHSDTGINSPPPMILLPVTQNDYVFLHPPFPTTPRSPPLATTYLFTALAASIRLTLPRNFYLPST